jgi:hypothetical protein
MPPFGEAVPPLKTIPACTTELRVTPTFAFPNMHDSAELVTGSIWIVTSRKTAPNMPGANPSMVSQSFWRFAAVLVTWTETAR